jgi:hypothetical protein
LDAALGWAGNIVAREFAGYPIKDSTELVNAAKRMLVEPAEPGAQRWAAGSITRQDILAARDLIAQGKKPTIEAVRNKRMDLTWLPPN